MSLSPNADKIFKMKYARTKSNGNLEEWEEACARVANHISSAESSESDRFQLLADFTKILMERTFIPGGRIIANAGTSIENLMNCFVLPIEDSRHSIYETLQNAAEIFAGGGGIGYNFSHLREEGAPVQGTGGVASGPLSFMSLFDQTGEVISQASRRGAQMGILNVTHPDVIDFINYKNKLNSRNQRIVNEFERNVPLYNLENDDAINKVLDITLSEDQLSHFNISVGITNEFMRAVKNGDPWHIYSVLGPDAVGEYLEVDARELMRSIAQNAWRSGDPGVFFVDKANDFNLAPYLGYIEATNPCGEVPLLPYEPCCLGSINLERFVEGDFIDFEYLKTITEYAVRFLDNVHDLSITPVDKINQAARMTRRIGLGVMGWADMLAEMGIPYDHDEAFELAEMVAKTIQTAAWEASMKIAERKGEFTGFQWDNINWDLIDRLDLERMKVRNVAVTSIAPTGSISLIAGVNSGIEPFFSHKYTRNITKGLGNIAEETIEQSAVSNTVKTAHEIHWKDHVRMQAAWQKWTCNAVSKTINMPHSASIEEIMDALEYAYDLDCKGLTIYRDGSRTFQILEG